MKKYVLLICALLGLSGNAVADVVGGSSDPKKVKPQVSTFIPFGAGAPGITMNPSTTKPKDDISINLAAGPVKHIKKLYGNSQAVNAGDSRELWPSNVVPVVGHIGNLLLGKPLAEVWYKKSGDIDVVTARQIAVPLKDFAPNFGAVTIATLKNEKGGAMVHFGEWSPKVDGLTNVEGKSLKLGMKNKGRVVWYVGDNPTRNIASNDTLRGKHVKYDVSVIKQHVPASALPTGNFYAYFGGTTGKLYGKVPQHLDLGYFDRPKNADINLVTGKITRGTDFEGQFYGANAEAIAGIYNPTKAGDRFAFGGKQTAISNDKFQ